MMASPQDEPSVRHQEPSEQIFCFGLTSNGVDDFIYTEGANTTYWISIRASSQVINGQWRWGLINPVGC